MAQRKNTRKSTTKKAVIVAPGEGIPFAKGPSLSKINSQLEDVYSMLMGGTISPVVADRAVKIKRAQMRRPELIVQAARINPHMRNALWEVLDLPVPETVKTQAQAPEQIQDKAA